jgi:hypothetical protein
VASGRHLYTVVPVVAHASTSVDVCLFLLRAGLALGDGVRCLTGGVSSWGARSSWATTMGMDHVYGLLFSIWKVVLFIWGGRGDREPFGPPCQVFPGFSAIMVVVAVQGPSHRHILYYSEWR